MQYGRDPYASQPRYFEGRNPQWDRNDESAGGYGQDRQRYQDGPYRQSQQGQYQANFGEFEEQWAGGGRAGQQRYASQPHYGQGPGYGWTPQQGDAQGDQGYSARPGYGQPGPSYGQGQYGQGHYGQDQYGPGQQYSQRQGQGHERQGGYAMQQEREYQTGPFEAARGGGEPWMSGGQAAGRSSHAGRAPKSYTRSDERIKEDINERLMHAELNCSDIEVEVSDGQVTLTGEVDSRNCKFHAEHIADSVSGVKDVKNDLRVDQSRQENESQRSGGFPTKNGAGGSRDKGEPATPSPTTTASRLATAGSRR